MFKIKSLPARFGDSFWIEYGDQDSPHRMLVDGGTSGTRHEIRRLIQSLPQDQRHLELLVVSHIDRDHIEGILGLLSEDDSGIVIEDIWFNGWPHLPENSEDEMFGAVQGERLTESILELDLPWNKSFGGKAVMIPDDGPLPQITLLGGLRLTLLSPTCAALADLRPKWEQEVRQANLDPGFGLDPNEDIEAEEEESFGGEDIPDVRALGDSTFEEDHSEANGSSIAFIAEFEGKSALFAADAHAGKLVAALERLAGSERISLDLFKVSHHGSKHTTSRELIEKVDCPIYLFSTNGSIFKHPHAEAVSRILVAEEKTPTLIFNYRSPRNEIWDLDFLKEQHGYRTRYPVEGQKGIEIVL